MNNQISQLSPNSIWKHFEAICTVPRPSKKEEKIIAFLKQFATDNHLGIKIDQTGNVLISKPATSGYENCKTVILQSHLDMVCEKNSTSRHNFDTDPIVPYIDGEWVKARGTTLGADCGIGIATQLAVLTNKTLQHGPIECLFTVDEETGLTGAFALQPGFMTGSILLNLDSEDEGELFIGCAGGIDTLIHIRAERVEVPSGFFPIRLSISGLQGGHSGDDINKGRGNAIKLLVRFIWSALQKYDIKLATIEGGNLRNAIPREATAVLLIPSAQKEALVADFNIYRFEIEEELKQTDPGVYLQLESTSLPETIFSDQQTRTLIRSLVIVPSGVFSMSYRLPGLVETSTNLASVKTADPDSILITTSQRSDRESGKQYIASIVRAIFEDAGASVEHTDGYPGWSPNPNSELLNLAKTLYQDLFCSQPVVRSIHAGLECGLFLEKYPYLDMISFGPTIQGAHSPDERLQIASVQKFWDFLVALLQNMPRNSDQ